jgi:uncharacterized protein
MTGWQGALALLLAVAVESAELPAPPTRQFDDRAGLVSADVAQRLEERLRAERERSGHELVVAIFPALPGGAALEDFTLRAAESWRVGRQGQDDGAVLFVFVADRRLRLEVGYGLEAELPDVVAKRILDDVIAPRLREGEAAAALEAGVDALVAAVGGRASAPPAVEAAPARRVVTLQPSIEGLHRLAALPLLLALAAFFVGRRGSKKVRQGALPAGLVLAVILAVVGAVAALVLDAERTLRVAALAAGAGLLVAVTRGAWRGWVAGATSVSPSAAATVTAATALLGVLQLASASGSRGNIAGWSWPALASYAAFQAFGLLGVWRAKLWSERFLYLGAMALIAFCYVQPSVMDGRFPSFILLVAWAPIWSGVTVMLSELFSLLGLKPARWWYDASGRRSGLAGGSWSSRGYSSGSSGSGYSGGGGRFGGGGASGGW